MKIQKTAKLEKITLKHDSRYSMNNLQLDVKAKRLIATDGHALVMVPVELEDGDETGLVPPEALIEARRGADRKTGQARIELNGTIRAWGKTGATTYNRPTGAKFPDWRAVVPKPSTTDVHVSFNAKYLLAIAEAMGTGSVVLRFNASNPNGKPIRIEPCGGVDGAIAVLMPIKL